MANRMHFGLKQFKFKDIVRLLAVAKGSLFAVLNDVVLHTYQHSRPPAYSSEDTGLRTLRAKRRLYHYFHNFFFVVPMSSPYIFSHTGNEIA